MRDNQSPEAWLNTILLHGGPEDGRQITISETLRKRGYLIIPRIVAPTFINPDIVDEVMTVPVEKLMYQRRHVYAGQIGTCEYREWYEWHIKE